MKEISEPLNIDIYLDYVCPWCYIAAVRLLRLKEECGEAVTINWKSFPLDPYESKPKYSPDVININRLRAGMEETSLLFEPWPEGKDPPGSSMPAHEAAKCARIQGREAFERYQLSLVEAYSTQCRDISDRRVLISLAEEAHLDVGRFISDLEQGFAQKEVLLDYEEAVKRGGIHVIPTVIFGNRAVLEVAVPLEVYRQAVRRLGNR